MNNTNIEIVKSLSDNIARARELSSNIRNSAMSRQVWFVGIAGYALINARPFWEAIHIGQLTGFQTLWLSIPWAITAIVATISHYIFDEVNARDALYYTAKISALDLHKIKITSSPPDVKEFVAILNDTDAAIQPLKNDLETWARWAARIEKLTFSLLILSFIWTLVGPLVV